MARRPAAKPRALKKRLGPKKPAMKKKKAARAKKALPSSSSLEKAVVDQLGTATLGSIQRKGHSSKLGGVGISTLKRETKKQVKKLSGMPTSTSASPSPRRRSASPAASSKKMFDKDGKRVCLPRMSRSKKPGMAGRMYETVPVAGRCVKAGGATAKMGARSKEACPSGKTLTTYKTTVPITKRDPETGKVIVIGRSEPTMAQRCVKAVGQLKNCYEGLVIARYPRNNGLRCVKKATAAKAGAEVVGNGTLKRPLVRVTADGRKIKKTDEFHKVAAAAKHRRAPKAAPKKARKAAAPKKARKAATPKKATPKKPRVQKKRAASATPASSRPRKSRRLQGLSPNMPMMSLGR